MKTASAPEYPQTPPHSPVHDEEKRNERDLRGSIYHGDDGLDGVGKGVSAIALEPNATTKPESVATAELFKKWKRFLSAEEEIEMGSTVERNKFFGMASEKSVMVLTAERVLLIDAQKMALRKNGNIPRASVVSCSVVDKETFELRFVKNRIKFKCSGPKAEKWKAAFERMD